MKKSIRPGGFRETLALDRSVRVILSPQRRANVGAQLMRMRTAGLPG